MSTVRKTITLTDQQDNWIKAQIQGGITPTTVNTFAT